MQNIEADQTDLARKRNSICRCEFNCFFLAHMSYKVLEQIDLSLSSLIFSETKEENLVFLGFPACYELCSADKSNSC